MNELDNQTLKCYFSTLQSYEEQQLALKKQLSIAFLSMADYRKSRPQLIPKLHGDTHVQLQNGTDAYILEVDANLPQIGLMGPCSGRVMQNEFIKVIQDCVALANSTNQLAKIQKTANKP